MLITNKKLLAKLTDVFASGYLSYNRLSELLKEYGDIDSSPEEIRQSFINYAVLLGYDENTVFPFLNYSPKQVLLIENMLAGDHVGRNYIHRKFPMSHYEFETINKGDYSYPFKYSPYAMSHEKVRYSSVSVAPHENITSHETESFPNGNKTRLVASPETVESFKASLSLSEKVAFQKLQIIPSIVNRKEYAYAVSTLDSLLFTIGDWSKRSARGSLSDAQVRMIRLAFHLGVKGKFLSLFFNISPKMVSKIVSGEAYPHVSNEVEKNGKPTRTN